MVEKCPIRSLRLNYFTIHCCYAPVTVCVVGTGSFRVATPVYLHSVTIFVPNTVVVAPPHHFLRDQLNWREQLKTLHIS